MIGKFTFQAPSNILFEPGASRKIDELVAGYGARRVMLVTDKGVRGAGLTKAAEASVAEAGIEVSVFDDVVADPPSHVVEAAVAACQADQVELVLSIGGGSALDTAKLVAYLARTPGRHLQRRPRHSDLLSFDLAAEMRKCNRMANVFQFDDCGHVPPLMAVEQIDVVTRFLLDDARSGAQER